MAEGWLQRVRGAMIGHVERLFVPSHIDSQLVLGNFSDPFSVVVS